MKTDCYQHLFEDVVRFDLLCSCTTDQTSPRPQTDADNSQSSPQPSPPSHTYNMSQGNRIADEAYYLATQRNTIGYCYTAVADAVEAIVGRFLWGS